MYVTGNGDEILPAGSHIHERDARSESRRNRHEQAFKGAHIALTPTNQRWDAQVFLHSSQGLDRLRRSFDEKAFLMRRGSQFGCLGENRLDEAPRARVGIGEPGEIRVRGSAEFAELRRFCLEKRRKIRLPCDAADTVAADAEGNPMAGLAYRLGMIRRTATNAGANGEMCRMLVAARRKGGCGAHHARRGKS